MRKFLFFMLLFFMPFMAKSTQWEVLNTNNSGSGSLRAMVGSAAAGDTITFNPSLYGDTIKLTTNHIAINSALTIWSPHPDSIIISGSHITRIFDNAAPTRIHGITFIFGKPGSSGGGAIFSDDSLYISHCYFYSNAASQGGAIYNNSSGYLGIDSSSIFEENVAISDGGGGAISNRGICSLANVLFYKNISASEGGAISNAFKLSIDNSIIRQNQANYGAIYSEGPTYISNSLLDSNLADIGGGLYFHHSNITDSLIVTNSIFNGNKTNPYGEGGALFIYGPAKIYDSNFDGNQAYLGGAIFFDSKLWIRNTNIHHCHADTMGGGIFGYGRLEIENCSIDANTAVHGGGIVQRSASDTLIIHNTVIKANQTDPTKGKGGGIWSFGKAFIDSTIIRTNLGFDGGGVNNSNNTYFQISNSIIDSNIGAYGGGLFNYFGDMRVSGSTVANNSASFYGGGIYNVGVLSLTNNTINGNYASQRGAGIYNSGTVNIAYSTISGNSSNEQAGGIQNNGTATVKNSTVNGNYANNHCGGIFNFSGLLILSNSTVGSNNCNGNGGGILNYDSALIDHATIYGNGADYGGGVYTDGGSTTLNNSIVAGNSVNYQGADGDLNITGYVTPSSSYNLIGDSTDFGVPNGNGNIQGTSLNPMDAALGSLSSNGGPTLTYALLCGSPAYNAADPNDTASLDQRGFARPFAGRNDIGAVETQSNPNLGKAVSVTSALDFVTGSLRQRISDACPGDTIIFGVLADTIQLSDQISIDKDLVIDGPGAENLTISSTGGFRLFHIQPGVSVQIKDLSLVNGREDFGGCIYNEGTLALDKCILRNNKSTSGNGQGGAIYSKGPLTITECLAASNEAISGGFLFATARFNIERSAIVNNNATNAAAISIQPGTNADSIFIINNSTISGNRSLDHSIFLGFPKNQSRRLIIRNATFKNIYQVNGSGDIKADSVLSKVELDNSIITALLSTHSGEFISNGYNLIGNASGSGINKAVGDTFGTLSNPILPNLSLLDYSQFTPFHRLTCGSIAFNAGNSAFSKDQVGNSRGKFGADDIGAYENQVLVGQGPMTREVINATDGGSGSLREVINNACPGDTVIFNLSTNSIAITAGQILINKDLVIIGPGAASFAISGANVSRIFSVNPNVSLQIKKIKFVDGKVNLMENGGAILNLGNLVMDSVTIEESSAFQGGGLYNGNSVVLGAGVIFKNDSASSGGAIYNAGQLTIKPGVKLLRNTAAYGGAIFNNGNALLSAYALNADSNHAVTGGAIFNEGDLIIDSLSAFYKNNADSTAGAIYSGGLLTINYSLFNENTANTGGAILSKANTIGSLKNVQFIGNRATSGGAITNKGYLTLEDSCVFFNNQALQDGGAIYSEGPLTITQSTLDSNLAGSGGGAISLNLVSSNTISSISRTTFYRNTGGKGGAISQLISGLGNGVLNLTNSTISMDSARFTGGGIYLDGGSIFSKHNTIANNSADKGEGIHVETGRLYLFHTLSANKIFSDGINFIVSQGFNLFSDTNGAKISLLSSDIVEDSISFTRRINLGKLSYQGGKTKVHTIDCNSLAYNNGSAFTAVSGDQVGNPRVANGFADIGAFEFQTLTLLPSTTKKPSCFGRADGNIQLNVKGGVSPYHVILKDDNNVIIKDTMVAAKTITIESLAQGNYKAVIRGADSCSADSTTLGVVAPAKLGFNIITDSVTCFDNSDGTIKIGAFGGSRPYNITLNSITELKVDSFAFNSLDTGTYRIQVVDTNGCRVDSNQAIHQPDSLYFNVIKENIHCFSANDGKLVIGHLSGGTPPYSFNWQHNTQNFTDTNLLAIGDTGVYTLTVTDRHNCTRIQTYHISSPAVFSVTVGAVTHVLCNGNKTGEVVFNLSGGTLPYQIDTATNIRSSSYSFKNLPADTFNLIAKDSNLCTTNIQVVINQPDSLKIKIKATNNRCYRDTTARFEVLENSGGVGPYSYLWEKIGTIQTWNTPNISRIDSGMYRLTLTDANGCTVKDSGIVDDPRLLQATLSASSINCHGDSSGSVTTSVTGGTGGTAGYLYSWSNGKSTSSINNLITGNYQLVVTDSLGCKDTASAFVSEADAIRVYKRIFNLQCYQVPTGTIMIDSIRGGQPFLTGGKPYYQIFKNQVSQTVLRHDSIPVKGLAAGKYELLISDAAGCEWVDSIPVNEPPQLNVLALPANVKCYGDSTGLIFFSITGGKPDNGQYPVLLYESPDTIYINNAKSDTISVLKKGNYTLKVSDSLGCPNIQNIAINQPANPLTIDSVVARNLRCFKDSTGFIEVQARGGTPVYKYSWSNGEKTNRTDSIGKGSYLVEVTDANGCDTSRIFIIKEPPLLSITDSLINVKCLGDETGKIFIKTKGGTGNKKLNWRDSLGNYKENQQDSFIYDASKGYYFLTATDDSNCVAMASYEITEPAFSFLPTIAKKDISCYNSRDGQLIFDLKGGTIPYLVKVSDSAGWDTLIWSASSFIIYNRWDSNYYSTVQDTNGCNITVDTTKINEPLPLVIDTIYSTPKISGQLASGSISIKISGGTPDYVYLLKNSLDSVSTRLSDKQHTFTGINPGIYDVRLSDFNGCRDTAKTVVGLIVTGVPENPEHADEPYLYQNVPNPAMHITTIQFYLPERMRISLVVINSMGQQVAQIFTETEMNKGTYQYKLYTQDLAPGTYFYLLQTPGKVLRKKMIIVH